MSQPRAEDDHRTELRRTYVEAVLTQYRRTQGTVGHVRPHDRKLAHQLFDQGVPLSVVLSAFTLAVVRRGYRPQDAPPLDTIRTLHYFRPLIEEIIQQPLDPFYVAYLNRKLDQLEQNGGVPPPLPPPPADIW
jgi:hypothetical protein